MPTEMIERILSKENLEEAKCKVMSNKGSAGVDRMKDGKEVYSAVLDSEYWDSFNEQMAELGNNLRDSGIEVRQMSREEMEKMQKTIRQSLKGLDAYAIAE